MERRRRTHTPDRRRPRRRARAWGPPAATTSTSTPSPLPRRQQLPPPPPLEQSEPESELELERVPRAQRGCRLRSGCRSGWTRHCCLLQRPWWRRPLPLVLHALPVPPRLWLRLRLRLRGGRLWTRLCFGGWWTTSGTTSKWRAR